MKNINHNSLTPRRLISMFFFIFLAALLWLIIKLSSNYTVTEPFTAYFTNLPSEKLISCDHQQIRATISTTGYKLLNYYFTPINKRNIYIDLDEIPYHSNIKNTYTINGVYAEEAIATFMDINKKDIIINEPDITFTMDDLASKFVSVIPDLKMSFERQYSNYGNPKVTPDSVRVYGSADVISTLRNIYTQSVTLKNLNQDTSIEVPLDLLGGKLHTDISSIKLDIEVEKYTEAIAEVPIMKNDNIKLRLFPEKVQIRYVVALKDYSNVNSLSFRAEIDTLPLLSRESLLPVQLTQYPDNTQIMSISPQEVEYIIIQE